jgi:hypothetical protein
MVGCDHDAQHHEWRRPATRIRLSLNLFVLEVRIVPPDLDGQEADSDEHCRATRSPALTRHHVHSAAAPAQISTEWVTVTVVFERDARFGRLDSLNEPSMTASSSGFSRRPFRRRIDRRPDRPFDFHLCPASIVRDPRQVVNALRIGPTASAAAVPGEQRNLMSSVRPPPRVMTRELARGMHEPQPPCREYPSS